MIPEALEAPSTQHRRLFTFHAPLPAEQQLALLRFSGHEAMSELFRFNAELIS